MVRPGKGLVAMLALPLAALALFGLGIDRAGQVPPAMAEAARSSSSTVPPPEAQAQADDTGRIFLDAGDAERGHRAGLLPPGVRSILNLRQTLQHGEYHWNDEGVPPGELTIRVDVRRQLVSVFRGGHEIGAAVVLYGTDGKETPLGRFPIRAKSADYRSRTYDAPMPYSLWMTDDGVAMHGSAVNEGRATNGCVGVPIGFARHVFQSAEVGDVIEVVRPPENVARAKPLLMRDS